MTDRDRSIERLLRHAVAPSDELSGQCLDAETLAALADDTLPAAARRDAEMHLADCGRCQALIVAMARTAPPAGTMAVEVSRARRAFIWLVPAAAAAAAVALWVLAPDQPTAPTAPPISDQQASAVPPAAAVETERRDSLEAPARRPGENASAGRTGQQISPADLARMSPASPEVRQEALKLEESPPVAGGLQDSGRAASTPEADAVGQQRAAASARAAFEIASPNPRIRWRVGPAGTVQRTEDQGVTWTSQQIGVAAELTAGNSPAADVCWLVGRGGIVLRTIDAGRSWQRAALPGAAEAIAITASTGVDAVVTLADGRRLATSDGGRTWAPLP